MKKIICTVFLSVIGILFAEDFSFLNRLQLDVNARNISGRVRVDMLNKWNNDSYKVPFECKAYAAFSPIPEITIGAGNSFFKKYPVKAAYLSASNDYLKTGRLLKSGAGILGLIDVVQKAKLSLSASITPDEWNESSETDIEYKAKALDVNLGFDLNFLKDFSAGAMFNKINETDFQYGLYAGYRNSSDVVINAGYVYNFRDDLMAKTLHALVISGGYKFSKYGIGIYGDFISGLNNEYLSKSGKKKAYTENFVPYYGALSFVYEGIDDVDLVLRGKMNHGFLSAPYFSAADTYTIEGEGDYKISKKTGTVTLGIGFDWIDYESSSYKTDPSVRFALGWKMKVSDK